MKHLHRTTIFLGAAFLVGGCSSSSPTPPATTPKIAETPKAAGENPNASAQPRRQVKVAMDPDASKIGATAQETTIEDINKQKVPGGTLGGRLAPFETTEWKVKAKLKSVQLMKDGDYYLVMRGAQGGEAVVEVPDPAQCKGSPLESQITEARKELEDKYHPTTQVKALDDDATVTGVGFLGWSGQKKKSQTGHSGPRLMPGTDFQFGSQNSGSKG